MPTPPTKPRPLTERLSTAILFLIVVFGVGMGIGALIGKLNPPAPVNIPPVPAGAHQAGATTDPTLFAVGDRIEVVFWGLAEPGVTTTKTYTVNEKGTIPIPLLGPLEVRGHTASQTEQAIVQGYRDRNVAGNMPVKVSRVGGPSSAPVH